MLLSLCMIAKNEESNIGRCLKSAKDIVDEMIIVDTGSTDSTVEIAKSYGAKVYNFPWNDNFSDARNYSLKQAVGDWILIMDADDELSEESRQAILDSIEDSDADAYFFETISYIGDKPGVDVLKNMNLRLLRNGKGYFYSNPIHEQIYCNIKAVNPSAKIISKETKVYHYGYLNKNIVENNKRARNIGLLEKELKEKPGNPFALFNLGSEYYAMGDNIKAIGYFEESYMKFNPAEGFSSHLIIKMVSCYMGLGRFDDALKLSNEGLRYYAAFTDLEYLKGAIQKASGKFMLAIKHFKKCCEMGEAPNDCNVLIGAGTFRASYMLGETYFYLEDYDSAIENYKKCLKQNPEYTAALSNLVKSLCRSNPGLKSLTDNIEELRIYQSQKFDLLIFDILMQEKFYDLAIHYIKNHEKAYGDSAYTKYNRGLCMLYLKKFTQVYRIMGQVKKEPEYCIDAVCLQALCKILEKKFTEAAAILSGKGIDRDNVRIKVFTALNTLIETSRVTVLSDDETESHVYTQVIFEILKVLIITREFETFEKSLSLLNSINDRTVLLQLAKLYYNEGCYGLAIQEFMRSVKIFDLIDFEGADMLYKIKLKGL